MFWYIYKWFIILSYISTAESGFGNLQKVACMFLFWESYYYNIYILILTPDTISAISDTNITEDYIDHQYHQ